jgi:hypothetical protein
METLIKEIITVGNIAISIMMAGCIGLYRMLKEERILERQARKEDAVHCAEATNRQTQAVKELTNVLIELRLDTAQRKQNVRNA